MSSKSEFVKAAGRDSGCLDVMQMLKDDETLIPYLADLIGDIVKGSNDKQKIKLFKFVKWCVNNAGDVGTAVISTANDSLKTDVGGGAGRVGRVGGAGGRVGGEEPTSDFLTEINIYIIFKRIVSEYKSRCKGKDHYELENILDRCFISIFQELTPDVLCDDSRERLVVSRAVTKMQKEITEKRIVFSEDISSLNKRLFQFSPCDLNEREINAVDIVESKVLFDDASLTYGKIEARIFCYKGFERNGLIKGSEEYPIVFTVKVNREQIPFLRRAHEEMRKSWDVYDGNNGDVKFLSMLLRYQSINSSDGDRQSSQQWGVPYKVYKEWYALGARYECFASPLNCRLPTCAKPDEPLPRFCSLFGGHRGVDTPFGSMGNFFDVDMLSAESILSGGGGGVREIIWCFNPPFIEDLMQAGVEKLIETMDRALKEKSKGQSIALVVIGVLPNWEDATAHKLVSSSKYTAYKKKLVRRKYEYESETLFVAPFDSLAFVMHSDAPSISEHGVTPSLKKFQHALDIWSL